MRNIFLILIMLGAYLIVHAQEPYSIISKHYNLDLTVNYNEEKLIGVCELTLTNNSTEPVDSISFLLYRLMKVTSITDINNKDVLYTQNVTEFDDIPQLQVNQICVYKTLESGESTTIKINYNGYILGYSETGMKYIKDCISPSFTYIRFDTYSYPYPCLPSIDMLRLSVENKFDYSLTVNVPDTLVAVCGGNPIDLIKKDGIATYKYNSKQPVWRMDIAIADYKQINSGIIDVFYFGNEPAAQMIAENGNNCLNLYEQWWGKLKQKNTLTIIETEEGSGGQTTETTILLPTEAFKKNGSFEYLYHEISHLWNVPILESQGMSPRWEEGLAEFSQVIASEKLGNEPTGYLRENTNKNIKWLNSRIIQNESLKNTPLIDYGNKNLTGYSYTHAMIMFSVLYHWLGENEFNKLIGGFYKEYYYAGASTKMFTDYFIEYGNENGLKSFFDDWMYTTEYIKHLRSDTTIDNIVMEYNKHQQPTIQ